MKPQPDPHPTGAEDCNPAEEALEREEKSMEALAKFLMASVEDKKAFTAEWKKGTAPVKALDEATGRRVPTGATREVLRPTSKGDGEQSCSTKKSFGFEPDTVAVRGLDGEVLVKSTEWEAVIVEKTVKGEAVEVAAERITLRALGLDWEATKRLVRDGVWELTQKVLVPEATGGSTVESGETLSDDELEGLLD